MRNWGVAGDERVRRVGATVERHAERWTPAVHSLLSYFQLNHVAGVPQPIDLDDRREVVSWIPGDAGPDGWSRVVPVVGLISMAKLLRRLHDASRGFELPAELSWANLDAPHAGEVVCHGDFGPWNVAWIDGLASGAFDWDMAYSGSPIDDVAYALEYVAPFRSDDEASRWLAYKEPPNRNQRIRIFWEAYTGREGTDADVEMLVDAVIAQQTRVAALGLRLAHEGIEPQSTWVRDGADDEWRARIEWSKAHRNQIIGLPDTRM